MKNIILAACAAIAVGSASPAFAAAESKTKTATADECPQSVCVRNGLAQGHAGAEAWCKANRKTKLTGPTCRYR